jgi:5-(carboxyamino)imidazole ribonucleotide synthase
MRKHAAILPGAVIGLLGGGQLARMTGLAARAMGYHIVVLDPDPKCAAAPIADEVIAANFDDVEAAARLARRSSVVTYEIERIAPEPLRAAAALAPLRPQAAVLECVQDREQQKQWLSAHGFPLGAWRPVASAHDLAEAVAQFGVCRVKRTRGGYDGRAQMRVATVRESSAAISELGGACVAEQELSLAMELSVLVARSPAGEMVAHPPAMNWHEDGILVRSLLPAPIEPGLARQATEMAKAIAAELQVEGLLVVEMFVTSDGRLLVNELAPRPHNTFHGAGAVCATGQFEQFVRAICGLPLGSTEARGAAVLMNLLGDLWQEEAPDLEGVLTVPGVSLHLYGKQPRPRRKVGHLIARAGTAEMALERAEMASARLQRACSNL